MNLTKKPYLRRALLDIPTDMRFEYPFAIPAVAQLPDLELHPDVTFFVGENGTGKSTVLEALALALGYSAEGGTRNVQLKTTDLTSSNLYEYLRLIKGAILPQDGYFLRAESFYNVASYMDEVGHLGRYGHQSLHERSHGESFLVVLTQALSGNGLYLLDEPEAALSPSRQLAALRAIDELVKLDSQFIIATHSPILLAYPRAKIYWFDQTGISPIAYEETEHFQVMKDFLNHYPRRLEQILADDL